MGRTTLVRGIGRLFTSAGDVLEDAALTMEDGKIAWIGAEAGMDPKLAPDEEVDVGGALLTPGLVDAHTHPVYAGNRFAEIALRSAGASYSEIAATGGGIASTVAATRAASVDVLAQGLARRLEAWLGGGTTTVEAKTGYVLDESGEIKLVRLLSRPAGESGEGGPAVEVTFLGGHAVGPEWAGDADGYSHAVASWCAAARAAGARHADVFCDEGYFTIAEARLMLESAKAAGLIPRIHADELACTGGAELAAELGCASADHLLRIDEAGIAALATSGVVATLAPVTALAMGRTPPARRLLEAGVTIALGSDHNPGTCGTTSMSFVVALAIAELGLSVAEALTAATAGGARSLRLADRGQVAKGLRADLVAWEADHEGAFAWSYGLAPSAVWLEGRRVEA
ncbi:MAG: imidazolonepropionase [Acidimicrobiales bacterium]